MAYGPFEGTPATEDALHHCWSRLLGVYEFYLHHFLEDAIKASPDVVVDVGAATGYYSVGLGSRLPSAQHIAFEMNDEERASLVRTVSRAGLRVDSRGECKIVDLIEIASLANSGFLVMDCEGGERYLLGNEVAPALRRWSILVEVHEGPDKGLGEELIRRFSVTHKIVEAWSVAPTAKQFQFLLPWPLNFFCTKVLQNMCEEGRGGSMQFLYMTPR